MNYINAEHFKTQRDDARRRESLARVWRYDEHLEQMRELNERIPEEFSRVFGGGARISLGIYLAGKEAAKSCGVDVSGGKQ